MNPYRIVKFLIIFSIVFSCACTKHDNQGTTHVLSAPYSIIYTGNPYSFQQLHFVSTASSGGSYKWSFGDGTTSTAEAPVHVFTTSGSFLVTMVYDNKTDRQAQQAINISLSPVHNFLSMLAGTRNWQVQEHYVEKNDFGLDSDKTYTYSGGSFAISVINDTLIRIPGYSYNLVYTFNADTTASHLFFGEDTINSGWSQDNVRLLFNTHENRIIFTHHLQSGILYSDIYRLRDMMYQSY